MKTIVKLDLDAAAKWCTISGLPIGLISFAWTIAHSSPVPTPVMAQPPITATIQPTAKPAQVTRHTASSVHVSPVKNQPTDISEQTDYWHPHRSPVYQAFISTTFYVAFFYSFTIFLLACFGLDFNPKSRHIYRNFFVVSLCVLLVLLGGNMLRLPWAF